MYNGEVTGMKLKCGTDIQICFYDLLLSDEDGVISGIVA
jgi:hypothetical protein